MSEQKEEISNKLISDEFIKKTSSLIVGATKGELYYLLNNVIQQIYPEHDTEEDFKSHIESVFWILKNKEENK